MSRSNGVVDAAQRQRALDYTQSFAVTAPAGSGKTELLIQRCLTLLAQVEKPEEILAITFTRKAANEMRSRILEALLLAQQEAPQEAHKRNTWTLARAALAQDQQYHWSLLDNPNRLRIQTIDSFCMHLVQRMPLLSKLGAEATISDDTQAQYQQAARHLLARLDDDNVIAEDLQLLLAHLDNNTARIEELLCAILSKREQWLRHFITGRQQAFDFQDYLEECLATLVEETLSHSAHLLAPFAAELLEALRFASGQLDEENPDSNIILCADCYALPDTSPDALAQWLGISELLLTKSGGWRARLTKKEGFPAGTDKSEKAHFKAAKAQCQALIGQLAEQPEILTQLAEIRALPEPFYDEQQWQILDALTRLLPTLVAELMLVFREQGSVDYSQISGAALSALGDEDQPSDLALILDYQLKHILVDEFQDTSTPQFDLLSRLTEGWEPDDGRTLFIVGDGMQSCYGFREANVGLFLAARDFGVGNAVLEAIDLQVNFRSESGVVDWINNTFKNAFPAQDNIARGAVAYSPSVAIKPGQLASPVEFFACVEQSTRHSEAAQVVSLVQQTLADYPADSVAILVRNRSHLRAIIPALHQAGIKWSAVDIDPLSQRPLISDLMALTLALLNPADRVAWLTLLRAPWCGLSLHDLHHLTVSKGRATGHQGSKYKTVPSLWRQLNTPAIINSLTASGAKSARRLSGIVKAAIDGRRRKPLKSWIEGVWLALGGPLTATSTQELAQAPAFFELLAEHESGGDINDISAFKMAVSRLYAKADPDPGIRLQVMTIHKSKGLEFDHVILPGLDRANRPKQQELLLWHERLSLTGEPQLLMGPVAAKGGDEDKLYQYLKREHTLKDQLENTRLAYVATTRAVKQLFLLANVQPDEKTGELKAPSENSLLHSLWPQLHAHARLIHNNAAAHPQGDVQDSVTPQLQLIRRLPADWPLPDYPRGNLLAVYRGHEYQHDQNNRPEHPSRDNHQQLAQCSTNLLLACSRLGSQYWLDASPQALTALIKTEMRRCFLSPEHQPSFDNISQMVQQVLADPRGQWLLCNRHAQSRTDWKLSVNNSSQDNPSDISTISIARAFVEEDVLWVIDIDSQPAPSPASPDESAARLAQQQQQQQKQQQQLQRAASAASQLSGLPVKAAIYFVHSKKFELISSD